MNCWECRDWIAHSRGRGQEASPAAAAQATADHLTRCGACREFAEHWAAVDPLLGKWNAPAPEPSAAARAELAAHLAGAQPWPAARAGRTLAAWNLRPPGSRRVAGAAALSAVLAVALLFLHWQGHARVTRPGAHRIATTSGPNRDVPAPQVAPPTQTPDRSPKVGVQSGTERDPGKIRQARLTSPTVHSRDKRNWTRSSPLRPRVSAADDLVDLNPDAEAVIRQWAPLPRDDWAAIEARILRAVRVRDDFVQIPLPRLASTSQRQIAEAVEQYKKQAAIVDPRLSREVTLAVKAMAFSDLCDRLRSDTGIEISAGPSVADEKVTIFCERRPLREIMREINRLFGFTWLRSGEEGKYRYELTQDLRSQLAEEELRNQDLHAAMLALDQEMAAYEPYLNLSADELKARLERASGPEKDLLRKLQENWGAVQAYHRLTPAQHLALLNGEFLGFSIDAPDPERRLPPEWRQRLLESSFLTYFNLPPGLAGRPTGSYPGDTPVAQLPGAMPTVSLRVDRSELGRLALKVGSGVYFGADPKAATGLGLVEPLAVGQSPSATKPDNAGANQALSREPLFRRIISFHPEPSCPRFASKARQPDEEPHSSFAPPNSLGQFGAEPPHVSTADVWEAVHRATGLNILADSYSHFYPVPPVAVERRPLFEGLCQVADALGLRWKKEGDFLVGRSASFFWDDLKEVPNRYLTRWQADKLKQGGLPLEDLLEMAALSDQQLNSTTVGMVIEHCWGLDEWWLVGKGAFKAGVGAGGLRPVARFLAGLTSAQRRQAELPAWLAFSALTRAQQQALVSLGWESDRTKLDPQSLRVQYVYAPVGSHVWETIVTSDRVSEAWKWPMVVGKTREAALAAARQLYPPAQPGQIVPSRGVLWLGLTQADGQSWGIGREPPMVPITPP